MYGGRGTVAPPRGCRTPTARRTGPPLKPRSRPLHDGRRTGDRVRRSAGCAPNAGSRPVRPVRFRCSRADDRHGDWCSSVDSGLVGRPVSDRHHSSLGVNLRGGHLLWYHTGTLEQEGDGLEDLSWIGGTPYEEEDWESGVEAPPRPVLHASYWDLERHTLPDVGELWEREAKRRYIPASPLARPVSRTGDVDRSDRAREEGTTGSPGAG